MVSGSINFYLYFKLNLMSRVKIRVCDIRQSSMLSSILMVFNIYSQIEFLPIWNTLAKNVKLILKQVQINKFNLRVQFCMLIFLESYFIKVATVVTIIWVIK